MSAFPISPEPFRIEPIFSPRIWGSRSLAPLFPEKINLAEPLGEAWLTGLDCKIATGPFAGRTLGDAWREMPPKWRGADLKSVKEFPLLLKFIFPTDKLSIQVHPDDAYAAAHEAAAGGRGKTEMWHIVFAEPGAKLLAGLKTGVTREKFLEGIAAHTLEDLLETHHVRAGDTFYIPAGTPHTIGADMIVCEVQEYSDLTYRLYDYDRVDTYGKQRELHVAKALQVMKFGANMQTKTKPLVDRVKDNLCALLAACEYFAVERLDISSRTSWRDDGSFHLLVVLSGTGQIAWEDGNIFCRSGECFFLPAAGIEWSLVPNDKISVIRTYVPCLPSLEEQMEIAGFSEAEISRVVFN